MANNWYIELQSMAKTNPEAKKHVEALKSASTDEEKATAKQLAQEFVKAQAEPKKEPIDVSKKDIPEMKIVEQPKEQPKTIDPATVNAHVDIRPKPRKEVKVEPTDLTQPAYNKNWARMGLNREEELFKHGIMLRKMNLQERIAMRTAINAKIKGYNNAIQSEFRKKQQEQAERDAKDPEKIKWNHQRQMVTRIIEELEQNHNIYHILKVVDGLTPDIMKELLQNPANVAAFTQRDPGFVDGFYMLYGK